MKAFFDEIYRRYGDPEVFVARIKERLKIYGISQAALAERAGYEPSHVSRWLAGKVAPNMESMVRLDEALERLIEGEPK